MTEDRELYICTWGHHETEEEVSPFVVHDEAEDIETEYDICESCYQEQKGQ